MSRGKKGKPPARTPDAEQGGLGQELFSRDQLTIPDDAPLCGDSGGGLFEQASDDTTPALLGQVEHPGTTEGDMAADLNALQSAFQDRAKREQLRFMTTVDSEYWTCIFWHTREQKQAFLAALRWITLGDKYIDGVELAEKLGIPLPPTPEDLKFTKEKQDRVLNTLLNPE